MSTDQQQYSLEMQSVAIERYAHEHAFQIVKTYCDNAKSGVLFRGRKALQGLIEDVVRGTASFEAILVYDVSRWGRFQDADEAAHYEFVCKAAGIPIHYCTETFTNDGTLPSLIMKSLKRVMAGEFSRELGVKVFAGQKRLVQLGFRQGGPPGYGLRRMLVSAEGEPKHVLASGERKSIATDRVVLIPGPQREVRCVKRIYRMFIRHHKNYSQIARVLNRCGVPYLPGSEWNNQDVKFVLTHPKYAGFNVYGRSKQRLYAPLVHCPRSEWILIPNAFPAIVSQNTYAHAQRIIEAKPRKYTDEELLTLLNRIRTRRGTLSAVSIGKTRSCPSVRTFVQRFGSLTRAYELIGYRGFRDGGWLGMRRTIQHLRRSVMTEIAAHSSGFVSIEAPGGRSRPRFRLLDGNFVSLITSRTIRGYKGAVRWLVKSNSEECTMITLLARLNEDNLSFKDFFLIPPIRSCAATTLAESDPRLYDAVRVSNLSTFYESAGKVLKQRNQTWPRMLSQLPTPTKS